MSYNSKKGVSYYRIPPDGAGKHIFANIYYMLGYNNAGGVDAFSVGDYIVGSSSSFVAEVINVFPNDATTGVIGVMPEDDGTATGFTVGEQLLIESSPAATLASINERYAPMNIIVGKNNPRFGQHVDKDGAAFIRFTEGAQQLDAYGLTRIVEPQMIAAYDFKYGKELEDFTESSSSGGTITHVSNEHAIVLTTDDAVSGSMAQYYSRYRPLIWPGCSHLVGMAVAVPGGGKSNIVRRWGMYSNSNGVFFELSGTTLSVVKRSKSTGAVVETRIPQSSWNTDQLSVSSSDDGMILDVSKINVYWFNMHTFTGGRVRFGVYNEEGRRIGVHNEVTINQATVPAFRNMSLPIRVEQFNVANGAAGNSTMKFYACDVKSEGPESDDVDALSVASSFVMADHVVVTGTDPVPVVSFRAALLFNGVDNYGITVPTKMNAHVSGSEVIIKVMKNATLTSASFSGAGSYTPVEADISATAISGGREIDHMFLSPGTNTVTFDHDIWNFRAENMTTPGFSSYGDTYTLTAQTMHSGTEALIVMGFGWRDLR